jgi:hypothetical protein
MTRELRLSHMWATWLAPVLLVACRTLEEKRTIQPGKNRQQTQLAFELIGVNRGRASRSSLLRTAALERTSSAAVRLYPQRRC